MDTSPDTLKYTRTHEWIESLEAGRYRVGITAHAAHELGDLVYVELPKVGITVQADHEVCVIESVKAASDVYAPFGGTVVAVNDELTDAPGLINEHPFSDGWLFELQSDDPKALNQCLSAEDYESLIQVDEVEVDAIQDQGEDW